MPYVISRPPAKRARALAAKGAFLGLLVAGTTAVAAAPAIAAKRGAAADTSSCSAPSLVQPFLSWNDSNWYTLAPGESADNLDGTGWTLRNGAGIVSTTLADGSTGDVLDLPAGSSAVSPATCVASNYPTARAMILDLDGGGKVKFSVSYADTHGANGVQNIARVNGVGNAWTLSDPVGLRPGDAPGWQLVTFTFTARGHNDEFQIYNFYVDPYAKG